MDKNSKKDTKCNIKDKRIEIRVSKQEKKKIQKEAENCSMSVAEYLLYCGLYGRKGAKPELKIVQYMVTLEEVSNHIRNDYGHRDYYIERTLDDLWEKLQ